MMTMKSMITIGKNNYCEIFKPDKCPYCDKGIDAKVLNHFFHNSSEGLVLFVTLQCPICGNVFFCSYHCGDFISITNTGFPLYYSKIYGGGSLKQEFSSEINELSPDFVRIFNQSYQAEQENLDEIVGIGYRKAFEFLIKDYAIFLNPNEKEIIVKKQLHECISYIFSNNEKEIIKRTVWIGNDQTHYEKRHPSFNISDLKQLIMICVSKIETTLREKKYLKEIE